MSRGTDGEFVDPLSPEALGAAFSPFDAVVVVAVNCNCRTNSSGVDPFVRLGGIRMKSPCCVGLTPWREVVDPDTALDVDLK
jgi:hypothetical protein